MQSPLPPSVTLEVNLFLKESPHSATLPSEALDNPSVSLGSDFLFTKKEGHYLCCQRPRPGMAHAPNESLRVNLHSEK